MGIMRRVPPRRRPLVRTFAACCFSFANRAGYSPAIFPSFAGDCSALYRCHHPPILVVLSGNLLLASSDFFVLRSLQFRLAPFVRLQSRFAPPAEENSWWVCISLLSLSLKLVYFTLIIGCVVDNVSDNKATLIKVDNANKRGSPLEVVQVLTDLNFIIRRAYISSDGEWFMDVFYVTDEYRIKVYGDNISKRIQQYVVFHANIFAQGPQTQQAISLMERIPLKQSIESWRTGSSNSSPNLPNRSRVSAVLKMDSPVTVVDQETENMDNSNSE
ncbi:hypothetical protein BUALT_Bualt05G0040500 [Buddleja alternifolia]|uniref:ACT domain-containing protein ACR n=1 Tax=Buddleja alternifolia TaxID=168488 RepID=A0AAV6XNB4_9LAMI|nr:hypothetical protein BUALT_Bualt05G0040500 [Buddleja alternifolia]